MQVPVGHEVVSQVPLKLELNYRQVPRKCLFSSSSLKSLD